MIILLCIYGCIKLYKFIKKYTIVNMYTIKKEYKIKFVVPFTKITSLIFNILNISKISKTIKVNKIKFLSNKLPTTARLYFNNTSKQGCILYFHGGGFLHKQNNNTFKKILKLSIESNCKLLVLDYALTRKYKYPVQINQCMDLMKYIENNYEKLNIDINNLILLGDSAGGSLSLITAYKLKKTNISIKLLMLLYPLLDSTMSTKTANKFIDTPIVNNNSLNEIWNLYLNNQEYEYNIYNLDLLNMPKTYIEVAEFDPLIDEGYELYNKLKKSNVDVSINLIKNAPHAYDIFKYIDIDSNHIETRLEVIKNTIGD